MSGFVATPAPAVTADGTTIEAGDFWPSLDVNAFRDAMRIGGQAIPDARVFEALMGAVIVVADNLADWSAAQIAAGYTALHLVPSAEITHGVGEAAIVETRLTILWRRAVHAFATADLIETHRDVTAAATTMKGEERQAMLPDDHRRNAVHAIRAIIGVTRTAVELI